MARKHHLVTLLTDFGTQDPYVAAMKGVILSVYPDARIVDITHDAPAHDVVAAGFILAHAAGTFPADTIHVVVVDPGVGTDRRILGAKFNGQTFLFPDNGVITFVAQEMPMQAIHVFQNPTLMPAQLSSTFHGRDLFAPLAGLLLNDMPLARIGPQPDTYKLLEIAQATEQDHEIVGQVLYADHFGNLVTNIPERMIRGRWSDLEKLHVTCAGWQIEGVRTSYAFAGVGEAMSLFNSMHLLEIAVNQGRAREFLQAPIGAEVRVKPGGNP